MAQRLAAPLLRAIAYFHGRCTTQLAKLALNRELTQCTLYKMAALGLMLQLRRRHALPVEVAELIVNRAYPTPRRHAPQWIRQRHAD